MSTSKPTNDEKPQARRTGAEPQRGEHGPSTPDQASAAEQEDARATPLHGTELPEEQRNEADNNPIERKTRQMAADGATAGEIAAYRADALAKLGK